MYLIKYATRGRRTKFLKRMEEIKSFTVGEYRVVVTIDEDDSEMVSILGDINRMPNTAGYVVKPWGKIHAINAYIPWHDAWELLVNYSDDMSFVKGWDILMMGHIQKQWPFTTDYFAHFSDGHVKERLPTMSIMGREYAERFGWIYPPMYKSVSCDAEVYYVAQMLGKYHYFPDVVAHHDHPVNNRAVAYDKTYKDNDAFANQDTQTYFHRMSKNFYINNADSSIIDKHKR